MLPRKVLNRALGAALATWLLALPARMPMAQEAGGDRVAATIRDYRRWTRVNDKPYKMEALVSAMCASAAVTPVTMPSPHSQRYSVVFVNGAGRSEMLTRTTPHFPVGTVIVKEKRLTPLSKSPELLTAMIRHETGYNPAGGDWEFLILDGTGRRVESRGMLERCQSCHNSPPAVDNVFRSLYLPTRLQNALK